MTAFFYRTFVFALSLSCLADSLVLELTSPAVIEQRLKQGMVRQQERQAAVRKLFEAADCPVQEQKVTRQSNVICQLPGETASSIIVGAHFDFVDRGEGVVDDWSGIALLSSLYQDMHQRPRKHTFRFVGFTAEERGLVGSSRYAKSLSAADLKSIHAFINLECLGVTAPKVWVSRSDPALLARLIEVAKAVHVDLQGVNVDNVGDDDTHSFLNKKIPVISIHSLTQQTWGILHSTRDNLHAIQEDNYYAAYKLIAFYLVYLDSKLA